MGPILSGRSWLMTEGLDPGMGEMPGRDPLTGSDLGAAAGTSSPRTQAAGAGAPVPYREPGPAFSRNILVTRDFGTATYQTEPHIEANPNDPGHLVLGVIDYSFPAMSSYVSFDGGERWEGPFQVPYLQEDLVAGGDPVIAFDRDDNVYMNYISIGVDEFDLGPWPSRRRSPASPSHAPRMTASRGRSRSPRPAVASTRTAWKTDRFGRLRGTVDISFLDKPWMVTGAHPDDPERDVIYVTYTNFDLSYEILYIGEIPNLLPTEMRTTIELVASEDGGQTWSDPVAVSPTVRRAYGEQGDGSDAAGVFGTLRVVQGSQPTVTPDGAVHVAWMDSTDDDSQKGVGEIWMASSNDAGRTWSAPVVASAFNEIEFRPRSAYFRFWASSFPQIASGPDGEIYIVYTSRPSDKPNDDGDIFLVSSRRRRRPPGAAPRSSTTTTPSTSSSSPPSTSALTARSTSCGATCATTRTRPATTSTTRAPMTAARPSASSTRSSTCAPATRVSRTSPPTPTTPSPEASSSATTSPSPPRRTTSTWPGPIRASASSGPSTRRSPWHAWRPCRRRSSSSRRPPGRVASR